jgi:hypothetical protein
MKIIKNWRFALTIYIIAIILFLIFDFSDKFRPYHEYLLVASAALVFLSIVYQLTQKRWGKAILYSFLSFGVTVFGLIALMAIGLMIEVTGGYPTVLGEQDYKEAFESNTKLPFPESANLLALDDTVYGFGVENEYNAHYLIKLSKAEYKDVLQQVKANPDFSKQSSGIEFEAKLVNDIKKTDFSETFLFDSLGTSLYTISFHNDRQTIGIKIATY